MPLGFERLNERKQRPNPLINFIKPIQGPEHATAEDFLNRIAAQCYPVMKAAHISVMSLEEFPPNGEFLGRNFNAGECIQLVLKDRHGRWLGFKFVQMVMMHELAHCRQMNHGRVFWQVRNQFAGEMHGLWDRRYVGEGLWGRGQDLGTGGFLRDRVVEKGDVPEHLCGGTYRRRGRKRKRGAAGESGGEAQTLSYAERQQRRIARKFGKHGEGTEVGEDDLVRGAYEQGHRHQGKPRVAKSKRGRELRAQAALARLEAAKVQNERAEEPVFKREAEDDSGTEWSGDETDQDEARDEREQGTPRYVQVCGGEDGAEEGANDELNDLRAFSSRTPVGNGDVGGSETEGSTSRVPPRQESTHLHEDSETESEPDPRTPDARYNARISRNEKQSEEIAAPSHGTSPAVLSSVESSTTGNDMAISAPALGTCPICSLENSPGSHLCMACSHVLRPALVRDTWRCQNGACGDSGYLNAGDAGRCGVCGVARPASSRVQATTGKPVGVVGADVLRWD